MPALLLLAEILTDRAVRRLILLVALVLVPVAALVSWPSRQGWHLRALAG